LAISLAVVMWPTELICNTCFASKPVKISGALCGRVFNQTGDVVANAGLRVLDGSGKLVAEVKADFGGDFIVPRLAKGKYRLDTTTEGYCLYFSNFEMTGRDSSNCRKPITVELGMVSCSGWISKKRPRHFQMSGKGKR
jgi:hypothetical protein